jgi:hypothetical protein
MPRFYAGQKDYVDQLNAMDAAVTALGGTTNVGFQAPFATSLTLDASTRSSFDVLLTGNTTVSIVNGYDMQRLMIRIREDATGNRAWTFAAGLVRNGIDTPSYSASTVANKTDYVALVYNAIAGKWDLVGINQGF